MGGMIGSGMTQVGTLGGVVFGPQSLYAEIQLDVHGDAYEG